MDVRIKALGLMKRIFSLPGNHFAQDYHQLFVEFLNRSCDKSAEVRLITLACAKAFYMTNPSAKESLKVLGKMSKLESHLFSFLFCLLECLNVGLLIQHYISYFNSCEPRSRSSRSTFGF